MNHRSVLQYALPIGNQQYPKNTLKTINRCQMISEHMVIVEQIDMLSDKDLNASRVRIA